MLIVVVGCTKHVNGTAKPDTKVAPAYRSSVSASVSASSASSRVRETQRQQSLTRQAAVNACNTFSSTANDAIDKTNAYTRVLNNGGNTSALEGPARDSLNHSATAVTDSISDPLSQELRDALTSYADAARNLAKLVGPNPAQGPFNAAVNQFNDRRNNANRVCRASG